MRKRTLIILSASAVCVGGLALIFGSKNTELVTAPESSLEQTAEASAPDKINDLKPGSSEPAAPSVVAKATQDRTEVTKVWNDFARTKDLESFGLLNQKALLLPADKIVKARLMKDERFLTSLEPLLKVVPVDADTSILQEQALDFVFEALNSEMRSAAIEILKNVAADGSVENSAVDMADRSALAGVKAEALFNLASAEPNSKSEIESLLPGPVSKKIWENVQQRQESNLAESANLQVSK
ncbi:hypothetical protein D3C87_1085220 [compost metagenome]